MKPVLNRSCSGKRPTFLTRNGHSKLIRLFCCYLTLSKYLLMETVCCLPFLMANVFQLLVSVLLTFFLCFVLNIYFTKFDILLFIGNPIFITCRLEQSKYRFFQKKNRFKIFPFKTFNCSQ